MAYAEGVSWPAAAWSGGSPTGSPTLNRLRGDSLTVGSHPLLPVGVTQATATSYFNARSPWGWMGRVSMRPDGSVASRCPVNQTSLQVAANWGDNCYSDINYDNSSENKMVYVPQFCFYVDVGTDINRWVGNVGDTFVLQAGGTYTFTSADIHPAVIVDGVAKSGAYIGAYEAYYYGTFIASTSKLQSIAGVLPVSTTKPNHRTAAQNCGAGWQICTAQMFGALQMLETIEYANLNSQSNVGMGYVNASAPTTTGYTATNGTSPSGNGSSGSSSNTVPMSYRGVENLWGNTAKFVEGIRTDTSMNIWVMPQSNTTPYSDTTTLGTNSVGYANTGSAITASISYQYITGVFTASPLSWMFLMSGASGGSSSTYFCDATYTAASGTSYEFNYGGGAGTSSSSWVYPGIYTMNINLWSGSSSGARLCYLPG